MDNEFVEELHDLEAKHTPNVKPKKKKDQVSDEKFLKQLREKYGDLEPETTAS